MKYYSVNQASAFLQLSYTAAQQKLSKAGYLVPNPQTNSARLVVSEVDLLTVMKRNRNLRNAYDALMSTAVIPKPTDPPELTGAGKFATKKEIASLLPLYNGLVSTKDQLNRLFLLGQYRWKHVGPTMLYSMTDFTMPETWASPAEESFAGIAMHLQPFALEEDTTAGMAQRMSRAWADCLYEERTAVRRAFEAGYETEHRQAYKLAQEGVYKNEKAWKSAELMALLPPNYKVIL